MSDNERIGLYKIPDEMRECRSCIYIAAVFTNVNLMQEQHSHNYLYRQFNKLGWVVSFVGDADYGRDHHGDNKRPSPAGAGTLDSSHQVACTAGYPCALIVVPNYLVWLVTCHHLQVSLIPGWFCVAFCMPCGTKS